MRARVRKVFKMFEPPKESLETTLESSLFTQYSQVTHVRGAPVHDWSDRFRRALGWHCFLGRKADGALDAEFVRDQVRAMPAGVFIGQVHFENRSAPEHTVFVARFCECDECVSVSLDALKELQHCWRMGGRSHSDYGYGWVVN